jgi:hypothetical protein
MHGNANGTALRVNKNISAVIPNLRLIGKRCKEKNGKATININNGTPSMPSSYNILPVSDSTLGFVDIEFVPSILLNMLAFINCHELNP